MVPVDTLFFYAAVMGFVMAAPFGAVGAACALASIRHNLKVALLLAGGVLVGDAVLIAVVNTLLVLVPNLSWEEVRGWTWLWWPMVALLGGYGALMLLACPNKATMAMLHPRRPFLQGVGWTLFANAKNWLGTFAAYAGWQVAGLFTSTSQQMMVGLSAWLGGVAAWASWVFICWHAKGWEVEAEAVAQKLIGALCLLAAGSAAWTLLQA